MHIEDSTALVTGANRGIGKAFADALLDRGATKVYAAVRDVETVTDSRLVPIRLDVTHPARIAAVAREICVRANRYIGMAAMPTIVAW